MADPTNASLSNGRVLFNCPGCNAELAVDKKNSNHNLSIGSFGVTVSPYWGCPQCGLEGKIKNSRIIVTGRKRIPPSGARSAYQNPQTRAAIKIDTNEFRSLTSAYSDANGEMDPDDCPDRRKHGYYARVKEMCPICGGQWHDTETLTEEDIQALQDEVKAAEEAIEEDDIEDEEEEMNDVDVPSLSVTELTGGIDDDVVSELEDEGVTTIGELASLEISENEDWRGYINVARGMYLPEDHPDYPDLTSGLDDDYEDDEGEIEDVENEG